MKLKKTTLIVTFAAVCFLLFISTACKKATVPASNIVNQTTPVLSVEEAKQQRLAWNLKTLVEPYEHAGHTNPKWDEAAKLALTEFARTRANVTDTNEPAAEIISTNVAAAIQSGCDDPMVNYLYIKYALDQTNSKEAFTAAFYKMALAMEASSYPPIRKFYAGLRTTQQYGWANNWSTNWSSEMSALSHRTTDCLSAVLHDANTPAPEIYDACRDYLGIWESSKEIYPKMWLSIEPLIFKNWSNDSSVWLLKGEAYINMAWLARGNGTADTVTAEGQKLFNERLAVAENALTNGWTLNPNDSYIADEMITLEMGQGQGRGRMELWFGRAMEIDTNNYTACTYKLLYLAPKWYGSTEDMLQFGRECAQNKKWGGQVPLILVKVHDSISTCGDCLTKAEQAGYWTRPDVWQDIEVSFDRFLEVNPDALGWHHDYAHYAYQCQQWNEFLHQVSLFSGGTNFDYFGGKDKFDKMVQTAKEHASNPK